MHHSTLGLACNKLTVSHSGRSGASLSNPCSVAEGHRQHSGFQTEMVAFTLSHSRFNIPNITIERVLLTPVHEDSQQKVLRLASQKQHEAALTIRRTSLKHTALVGLSCVRLDSPTLMHVALVCVWKHFRWATQDLGAANQAFQRWISEMVLGQLVFCNLSLMRK